MNSPYSPGGIAPEDLAAVRAMIDPEGPFDAQQKALDDRLQQVDALRARKRAANLNPAGAALQGAADMVDAYTAKRDLNSVQADQKALNQRASEYADKGLGAYAASIERARQQAAALQAQAAAQAAAAQQPQPSPGTPFSLGGYAGQLRKPTWG